MLIKRKVLIYLKKKPHYRKLYRSVATLQSNRCSFRNPDDYKRRKRRDILPSIKGGGGGFFFHKGDDSQDNKNSDSAVR